MSASLLVIAAAGAAALALASCGGGGGGLLPGKTASQINDNLDQVQQLVGEGDCVGAEEAAGTVSEQVEALTGVDAKLKQALSEGAARLNEVVAACEEVTTEETIETIEPAEDTESVEKNEKPEKPNKSKPGEVPTETEPPTLPPQSNGKGEEEGHGPPVETGPPSGGVGPGSPTGEE